MKAKRLLTFSSILVFIGITVLSLMPPKSGMEIPTNDKVGHFIAYSVFALNLSLVAPSKWMRFYLLLGALSYSVLIEYLQGFMGRQTSFFDFLANSVGVVSGYLIFILLGQKIIEMINKVYK